MIIVTATVADIRRAAAGKGPSEAQRKAQQARRLIRIPSKAERSRLYTEAAVSIAAREGFFLPAHGGRPWRCEVRVSDVGGACGISGNRGMDGERIADVMSGGPKWAKVDGHTKAKKISIVTGKKSGALFRWFRGRLELACLPHIFEHADAMEARINVMPMRRVYKSDGDSDEEEDEEEFDQVPKTALQERQTSELSHLAWNNPDFPAPDVQRWWLSPDQRWFQSRSEAVDYANELLRRDKFVDRVLYGLSEWGKQLRPAKPTKKMSLEAGYYRFLRDGLWVVGQEEDWLEERVEAWKRRKNRKQEGKSMKNGTKREEQSHEKTNLLTLLSCLDSIESEIFTSPEGNNGLSQGEEGSVDCLDTKVSINAAVVSPSPITSIPQAKEEGIIPDTLTNGNIITKTYDISKMIVTAALPSKNPRPGQVPRISKSYHWRLAPSQIELCLDAVMDHYNSVMYTVKARNLHFELADGFDVLRERGRGRFDMELAAFDEPLFDFLTDPTKAAWMPVVRKILGEDAVLVHKGAFFSLPGSETQVYHQDGVHLNTKKQLPCHAINVFIPLVDLCGQNGPTEFCLGTHVLGYDGFLREMVETPLATAGTPIIFDYRLGHRGMRNSSRAPRPVVYLTYTSASKEFSDSVNFSRKRYRKLGELVDKPLSREERVRKRRESENPQVKQK